MKPPAVTNLDLDQVPVWDLLKRTLAALSFPTTEALGLPLVHTLEILHLVAESRYGRRDKLLVFAACLILRPGTEALVSQLQELGVRSGH